MYDDPTHLHAECTRLVRKDATQRTIQYVQRCLHGDAGPEDPSEDAVAIPSTRGPDRHHAETPHDRVPMWIACLLCWLCDARSLR